MKKPVKFSNLNKIPQPSKERLEEIKAFEDKDFSDNPEWNEKDWKKVRSAHVKMPKPGCMKGRIWMADDFDEPLDDFKE